MIRRALGVSPGLLALCLPVLAALSSAAHAISSSPEALRREAMRLFEKARSSGKDVREGYLRAEKKVMEAVGILEARPERTKTEEDLLVELTSLLYWIRKMTPIALPPAPPEPPPPPKPEPKRKPTPKPRPASSSRGRPKPAPEALSGRFRGLPARLEPIADDILRRYRRGYKSHAEVEQMKYQFFLRDFRQAYLIRKHPRRALEAAALIFQAVDEYDLDYMCTLVSVVRMQACLELDRLYRSKPGKGLSYTAHKELRNAYWNLAVCHYDFEPAVTYFQVLKRRRVKHPDVKLGLALAELAQSYVVSQVRVKSRTLDTIGRQDISRWFGRSWGKVWLDMIPKHNWSRDRMLEVGEDSRRLFKEYGAAEHRGWIYEAFSETYWLWYYRKLKEFDAKSLEVFRRFNPEDSSDVEKAMFRVLLTRWMRTNRYVDSKKVKWTKRR